MNRKNLITLSEAMANFNNNVESFDMWKVCTMENCDSIEEYEEAILNEEYERSKKAIDRPLYDIYTCNNVQYVAKSLDEAYFMALCQQGIKAVGAGVVGQNGDFMMSVCLEAYRKHFPTFTDNDFLEYDMTIHYAWTVFDKVKTMDFNDDYEWVECTQLCKAGLDFIQNNSKLARHMKAINWNW